MIAPVLAARRPLQVLRALYWLALYRRSRLAPRAGWRTDRLDGLVFRPAVPGWSDENRLFASADTLFRFVPSRPRAERWARTAAFLESADFAELQARGLVPRHRRVALELPGLPEGAVYEVERLAPFAFCFEFCAAQLVAAAVACCDVALLLAERGSEMRLTDADLLNVSFEGTRPVLVDVGAFSHLRHAPPLLGTLQFGLRREEKLSRSWIGEVFRGIPGDGGDPGAVSEVRERLLAGLPALATSSAGEPPVPRGAAAILERWLEGLTVCEALDVGGRSGAYAQLMAKAGVRVVSLDLDGHASGNHERARRSGREALFLEIDPAHEHAPHAPYWRFQHARLRSRFPELGWRQRLGSELVVAGATPLALRDRGLGFDEQRDLWRRVARRYLIVEAPGSPEPARRASQDLLGALGRDWVPADRRRVESTTWHLLERVPATTPAGRENALPLPAGRGSFPP